MLPIARNPIQVATEAAIAPTMPSSYQIWNTATRGVIIGSTPLSTPRTTVSIPWPVKSLITSCKMRLAAAASVG